MPVPRRRSDLLQGHLKSFTRLLHKVESGDPRAIHRTRVASRRLRELLPVLQLDSDVQTRLLRDLRKATRALGRVRELDVTHALLTGLANELDVASPGLTLAQGNVLDARTAVYGRAVKKGRLGRDLRRLVKRLTNLLDDVDSAGGADRRRWRWALEARVARRAERLADAIREAGPFYLPERLHAVRIAVKKLRYALELDGEAAGAIRPEVAMLKRGQELLGVLHDRQLVIERLRETQASLPSSDRRLSRELDGLVARLEDDCRTLHARYVRQRARLFEATDRLRPQAAAPAESPGSRLTAAR